MVTFVNFMDKNRHFESLGDNRTTWKFMNEKGILKCLESKMELILKV